MLNQPDRDRMKPPVSDPLRQEHLVLVADVGGTYLRLGLARNHALIAPACHFEREGFPDLESACTRFLNDQTGGERLDGASIAAAGPLKDGCIELTNAGWRIEPPRLASALGLDPSRVKLLNDFEAMAWALPRLASHDRADIPGGSYSRQGKPAPTGHPQGHQAILGPGTGLGVAALLQTEAGYRPLATEGGHASFAPETRFEHTVAARAVQRYGRASWERVLSGPGLVLLYEAALQDSDPRTTSKIDHPGDVLKACAQGDTHALLAANTFVALLGAFAGDLALLYNASGGITVGGGMMAALAQAVPLEGMRERFEAKGRFAPWLQQIPLQRVVTPFMELRGAAAAYCH